MSFPGESKTIFRQGRPVCLPNSRQRTEGFCFGTPYRPLRHHLSAFFRSDVAQGDLADQLTH